MGKTYTDFSQLSKGMFRKSDPIVEIKPIPKKSVGGDDALAYFGLRGTGNGKRGTARAGAVGGRGASGAGAGNDPSAALEARVGAAEAQIAAIGAERDAEKRKSADLERLLADERAARQVAEAERDRLRGEVLRLRNELEEALTAPDKGNGEWGTGNVAPVQEIRVAGLLVPPKTKEVFEGEVREHVLAVLADAKEAASQSVCERRAKILADVLAANIPTGELERRRSELRQIIKDTGSFVDARTISALERIGFKCVSGNKHWKLDYANVRIPISKTPSDHRAAMNTATSIANSCF